MNDTNKNSFLLTKPVLFLLFNRPDLTLKSFEIIRKVKPPRLYVSVDGPRDGNDNDIKKILEVKKILKNIDWKCDLKTLYQKKNLGCRYAVSEAISWFFQNEEEGIIMEDDNLPHEDFFMFCEILLERYRDNHNILTISGDNFLKEKQKIQSSYYFSKYFMGWGWATWRRTWVFYDQSMSFWPQWKLSNEWIKKIPDKVERNYWEKNFNVVHEKNFNSMAYVFLASLWFNNNKGLNIIPTVNLVSNIGHRFDATHTTKNDKKMNIPAKSIGDIVHPEKINENFMADRDFFNNHFGGKNLRMPRAIIYIPYRMMVFIIKKIIFLLRKFFY